MTLLLLTLGVVIGYALRVGVEALTELRRLERDKPLDLTGWKR